MNLRNKKIIVVIMLLSIFITTGFTSFGKNPQNVYRVYLKGKSIGLIESKEELENYINKKQSEIKEKYNVDKVYPPQDLYIVEEKTFSNKLKTTKQIYNEIKDVSPFTISGYIVKIKGLDTTDLEGNKIKGKVQKIYVLDKQVFIDSVDKMVKSFIPEESYNAYANKTQEEIVDTGSIIQNIYIKNEITIKKSTVPVNEKIYQTVEELTQYLIFGTTKPQAKYIVKEGDTIADVAFNNKISTKEFLIANPDLHDENSLLAEGQEVTLGILNPQFSVVEEDYIVKDEESNFLTETILDSSKCTNFSSVSQAGVKGLNRVTQIVQKVNGESVNTAPVSTVILKESVKEIITKGSMNCSYGWSNVGPLPSKGYFAWPATCGTISSPYGYRWGTLHDAIDIAGCGYGSALFAAAEGEVVQSAYKYDNGNYVTIKHPNGYYTIYAHMCNDCRYVSVGDYVQKGQVIGGMGMTGYATGVHVHFGVWKGFPYYGGTPVNPMNFF